VVKRSITLILSLLTVGVGLWVMTSTQTLEAACTLGASSGTGNACGIDLPFYLLGIALITTGAASTSVALLTLLRSARRKSMLGRSTISTLHPHEVDSLRDVA
jgi:hypothetical protein